MSDMNYHPSETTERDSRIREIIETKTKAFVERPKKSWRDETHTDVVSNPELLKSYESEYGTVSHYLKNFDTETLLYIEKIHLYLTNYATRIEITLTCYLDGYEMKQLLENTTYQFHPTSAGRIKLVHYNKNLLDRY